MGKKSKISVFAKKKTKPKSSINAVIQGLEKKYEEVDFDSINTFNDVPLSSKTLKGLKECHYSVPTDIQKQTLKLGLTGKDILGAAQTGSGKTLAFLIPILERLYCKQWSNLDGIGALVITPTRELAFQIFEELRRVGEHHDFSAGLIIGGKDLKFERNRMDQCNIIICTPGRLLQHMDENPLFDCVNLEILVLDEADRCLDLGFEQTMNAIIGNLPEKRQTMLFSATQTKSVRDLARLSLKNPSYVSVHENSEFGTPKGLQQSYVICELKDKISIIWSFIKNHLKQKVIIFFASCKEVKYVYEVFCKLRPGVSLMALYGTLHQLRRMDIYQSFCSKSSAILFATDIAARGLDFPEVNWVVQADCPEDAATYIHRVGRTARYHRGGESLLLLLKSEMKILESLQEKKIPIEKIDINSQKLNNPVRKIEAYLAKDPTLKDTAQRAFVSYVKSVFVMKDKKVFNVKSLDTDSFANSLGLAIPPRIRFLQRLKARSEKNKSNEVVENVEGRDNPFHAADDDSEDDILNLKRKDHDIDLSEEPLEDARNSKIKKAVTKAAIAKKLLKKKIVPNKKIVFNEDAEPEVVDQRGLKRSQLAVEYDNEDASGIDIERAKMVLKEEDKFDKILFKTKVKAKHKEEKKKMKARKQREEDVDIDKEYDSESSVEPDLSWLPDPDEIYGKKDETDDIKPEYGENVISEISNNKRKSVSSSSTVRKKKKKKIDSVDFNVDESETLALMLLQNK